MGWLDRLRNRPKSYPELAEQALRQPNKQEILDRLPDDQARMRQCQAWAAFERARWYRGQADCIADMLNSTDPRYRGMHPEVREIIGRRKWGATQLQKDIAGAEQMYSRWAGEYAGTASFATRPAEHRAEYYQ